MAPQGLAILLGAGPVTGAGVARILAHPSHGNMAVALLARRPEPLNELVRSLRSENPQAVLEAIPSDTSPDNLRSAFSQIRAHASFRDLPLRVAVFSVKDSAKKPFLSETHEQFVASLENYVGGAMVFAQEAVKMLFEQQGDKALAEGGGKKGTLIFTGTLGALRCNAEYASYGAQRSSVRQLAQALAKELSPKGVHVAHTVINGRVVDADNEDTRSGKHISADAVGKTYLFLAQQDPTLLTHELDLRPAQEKF